MNENLNPDFMRKPKREYTAIEAVFAWLCLIFSYLLCRVFPVVDHPLGGMLFTVSLYFVTAVVLKIRGAKFSLLSVLFALSALVMQAALILSANSTIHFFVYSYALLVYLYFLYSSFGNSIEGGFSDCVAADFLKAIFVMPFSAFASIFRALSSSLGHKGGKSILRILLGVALALIPTVVIVLLLSYDEGFTDILDSIFSFSFEDIFSQFFSITFAVPIAMYSYGLFIASVDKKNTEVMSKEKCIKFFEKLKITPVITVFIAVLPVIAVYIIFFVSQWQYYVSGFSGVLPKNLSYAEYARSGFFELCIVSFINFFIITAVSVFSKRNGKAQTLIIKAINLILSLATLVLIATAISKMAMYINYYGLTPRRVYASWGMIVLAVVFLLIMLKQFIPRLKIIASIILVTVILFGALSLSGVDRFIAEYNVDRYLDGSLEKVDIEALTDLGDAGVPQLVRLAKAIDGENGTDIAAIKPEQLHTYSMYTDLVIALHSFDYSDCGFFSYTIPQAKAKAALAELGIESWEYDDFCKLPFNLRPDA
ncbi:MAG: DUF4173 domain-containing protein [Bacillota bacterium]|nr:DUF4173 domain-containing protein [Bacillota bacterium]